MGDVTFYDQVQPVIERSRQRVEATLPAPSSLVGATPGPFDAEARQVRQLFTTIDRADTLWNTGRAQVAALLGDRRFTPEELRATATNLLNQVAGDVDRELAAAEQLGASIVTGLRAKALVARPEPADATQEATLGNLRTDVRMQLDPLHGGAVAGKALDLVGRAMADDPGGLEAWFLTSTSWVADYLDSRGESPAAFTERLPQVVAPFGADVQRQARTVLDVLEGRDGVNSAITAARHIARNRVEDVRAMIARTV